MRNFLTNYLTWNESLCCCMQYLETRNIVELKEKKLSRAQKDAYDYSERLEKATTSEH